MGSASAGQDPAGSGFATLAEARLVGFGGWLAVLAFGGTIGPILTVGLVVASYELPRTRGNTIVLVWLLAILVVQLFMVVAMWRRRSYFPRLFAVQSGLLLSFGLLCLLGAVVEGNVLGVGIVIGLMAGIILWTIYVFRSRRVRNTFRRGGPNDLAEAVEAF